MLLKKVIFFSRADENYNDGNLTKGNKEQVVNDIKEIYSDIDSFKVERINPYPKEYLKCTVGAKEELKKIYTKIKRRIFRYKKI